MHPFILNREYRRAELLDYVGSKQAQSGVIWGDKEPGCLILTTGGRHGKKAGYFDEPLSDGSWWYFGQGQKGHHSFDNIANKKILEGKSSILLFTAREPSTKEILLHASYGKFFSYKGEFNACSHEIVVPEFGERAGDRLIRFFLVPAEVSALTSYEVPLGHDKVAALRQQIILNFSEIEKRKVITLTEYRIRSAKVRRYAILRANGFCEFCKLPAPFLDDYGNGFLEVHHILRLADEGVDSPQNVAAICPNCHRRAHYSSDRVTFNSELSSKILHIENELY